MTETEKQPNNPPAAPPGSSTPPGTTAGAPTPWRAPATAGKFAGKTAEEVLGIAEALADAMQATPAPAAPAAPAFDVADDEYLTGAQVKKMLEAARPTADSPGVTLAADPNVSIVRSKHAPLFAKYGPEIDALVARVPPHMRTLDNLEQCVRMVRSDHVDEIAGELATQRVNEMAPTIRSTGSGSPPASASRELSLENEKIPAAWLERARARKIDERTIEEFCRANDMSLTDFYKQFDKPLSPIVGQISTKGA